MKTKQPIQMIISALLLICVFNFAKGQSLLLPVPGSASIMENNLLNNTETLTGTHIKTGNRPC